MYIFRILMLGACVTLFLSGCTFCVNGKGTGCGGGEYPRTFEEFEAKQKAKRKAAEKKLNQSIVRKIYVIANDDSEDAFTIKTLAESEKKELEEVFKTLVDDIQGMALKHSDSKKFKDYFEFIEKPKKVIVNIVDDDSFLVYPRCESAEIRIPYGFIQQIIRSAISGAVKGELDTPGIPSAWIGTGRIERNIGSPVEEMERVTAVYNTAVLRAFTYVLAHEMSHMYADQCDQEESRQLQKEHEQKADLFASIVSSELYTEICFKRPLFTDEETFDQIVSKAPVETSDIGGIVSQRMAKMDLDRFLVSGGGDMEFLLSSLQDETVDDEYHPPYAKRVFVDENSRRHLISKFYNDLLQKVDNSIFTMLLPEDVVPSNMLYEGLKLGTIGFQYQERTTSELVRCSVMSFRSGISSGGF